MPESDHGLTLITPTCDRPAGMRLCRNWMAAQTFGGPVEWIIVDGGRHPYPQIGGMPDNWTVRHEPMPHVPKATVNFRGNLARGLTLATHNRIAIIEDDDHYKPAWLQWLADRFDDGHQLIGEARSRYYDVAQMRWRQMHNGRHASLCQTAFTRPVAAWLAGPRGALRPPRGPRIGWKVDIAIWREFKRQRNVSHVLASQSQYVTGIKRLPGIDGLTHTQAVRESATSADPDGDQLRAWVGDTAAAQYAQVGRRPTTDIPHIGDFLRRNSMLDRDVIVIGKGPTFSAADRWIANRPHAVSVGLNHVVERRYVDIAHAIDLDVLDQVPHALWFRNCACVVMPWRPHVGFRPTDDTLQQLAGTHPVLRRLHTEHRLAYYNLSTAMTYGYPDRPTTPDISCSTFSGEAVCRLLHHLGRPTIHTAGIDGGRTYHAAFGNLTPLQNGRDSFDSQAARLQQIGAAIVPV